jgi:hypothetical protein
MQSFIKVSSILLLSLIVVLTVSCVFQIVGITHEKFLAHEKQQEINAIAEESSLAFEENGNGLSLAEVEEFAKENNFVNARNITYLRVPATEVVVR